jgi:small conductance mechanosensitive channel
MASMIGPLLAAAATSTATDPAQAVANGVDAFWSMWGLPIKVAGVLVGAVIVRLIAQVVIRRGVDQIVNGVKRKQNVDDTQALNASPLQAVRVVQRTRTLGSVLSNVVSVLVVLIAIAAIVSVLGIPTVGLVSAASVIAAGLAFGAQNIVKDVLSGLFIVAEDQLGVGDIVDAQLATGVVEAVGIRVTKIRDVNGTLWFVRNGEILRVGNMSQGWARVIIDTAVPYDADIDRVEEAMLSTATGLAAEARWKHRIVEKPELWGIQSIADSAIVVRLVVRTRSSEKDAVNRELKLRLKKTMDALDITLPSLNSVVLEGFEEAASVRGARPVETAPTPLAKKPRTLRGRKTERPATPPPASTRRDPRSIPQPPTGEPPTEDNGS